MDLARNVETLTTITKVIITVEAGLVLSGLVVLGFVALGWFGDWLMGEEDEW
jgi:hypothetical protein